MTAMASHLASHEGRLVRFAACRSAEQRRRRETRPCIDRQTRRPARRHTGRSLRGSSRRSAAPSATWLTSPKPADRVAPAELANDGGARPAPAAWADSAATARSTRSSTGCSPTDRAGRRPPARPRHHQGTGTSSDSALARHPPRAERVPRRPPGRRGSALWTSAGRASPILAGRPVERHWMNVLSAGVGGLVDRCTATAPAFLGGRLAYAPATLRAIICASGSSWSAATWMRTESAASSPWTRTRWPSATAARSAAA